MYTLAFTDMGVFIFVRILEIAKAMRLKISKRKGPSGLTDDEDHKLATLSLPLPVYKPSGSQRKRKKMK